MTDENKNPYKPKDLPGHPGVKYIPGDTTTFYDRIDPDRTQVRLSELFPRE